MTIVLAIAVVIIIWIAVRVASRREEMREAVECPGGCLYDEKPTTGDQARDLLHAFAVKVVLAMCIETGISVSAVCGDAEESLIKCSVAAGGASDHVQRDIERMSGNYPSLLAHVRKNKTNCKRSWSQRELSTFSAQVRNLMARYRKFNTAEIAPGDGSVTSFVTNKVSMKLCLRSIGGGELHSMDLLKYVYLHELTHMAVDVVGHPDEFWRVFRLNLHLAEDYGLMNIEDYSRAPVNYCGLVLKNNTYFDPPS